MKNTVFATASLVLAGVCTVGLAACEFYPEEGGKDTWTDSLGISSALYDVATDLGTQSGEGEWMDGVTGTSTEAYKMYQEAKSDGFEGTFVDFLKEVGYDNVSDHSYSVGTAVQSVVGIYSTFKIPSGDSVWPGFGGWYGQTTSEATSAGAGVIYSLDKERGNAYIITNYHVVYYSGSTGKETVKHVSDDIKVCLYGMSVDQAISATYVGGAMQYDIAVLKIENNSAVKDSSALAARLADSDAVTAGDTVYAIGNPEGEGIAVSSGVVSVEAEYIDIYAADDKTLLSMLEIRTDTAVNHGNSGGGLFNADGFLVGIVNARLEDEDVNGFGYAIPSDTAVGAAQNIIDNSSVNQSKGVLRATLGVTLQTAGRKSVYSESTGRSYIQETVVVQSLVSGGAAEGILKEGDMLYSVRINDGEEKVITRLHNVSNLLLNTRLGDTWTISVSRKDEMKEVTVKFTEKSQFTLFS